MTSPSQVDQALWNDVIAVVIIGLGAIAWAVALIAAAVAHRQSGAPVAIAVLLGASTVALIHTPPSGPFGLACLAAGIAWLGWRQSRSGRRRALPFDRGSMTATLAPAHPLSVARSPAAILRAARTSVESVPSPRSTSAP